jgi:hypothetical protein
MPQNSRECSSALELIMEKIQPDPNPCHYLVVHSPTTFTLKPALYSINWWLLAPEPASDQTQDAETAVRRRDAHIAQSMYQDRPVWYGCCFQQPYGCCFLYQDRPVWYGCIWLLVWLLFPARNWRHATKYIRQRAGVEGRQDRADRP